MTTSLNLRNTLGRRLTATEIDANFTNLRSTADAATVDSFTASGTGATARTFQAKNRDIVSVKDFGAVGDGTTDDTAAIQAAINTGSPVLFPGGLTYLAHGLTQSTNGQVLYSDGIATIKKNANGVLLTCSGTEVQLKNLAFRGDAASPTYTGDNINASGNNFSMINCGSRWAYARAVKATGSHTQIIGTCDVYQTTDATASGFDIEIGASGALTTYHELLGIYSSQTTGGILLTDTGSATIVGGEFGKLSIKSGTSPAGINGGKTMGARILGNVTVELSNATFTANQFGAITFTLAAGTSLCSVDSSNIFATGSTVTNSGNANNLIVRETSTGTYNTIKFGGDAATGIMRVEPVSGQFVFTSLGLVNNVGLRYRNAADSGEDGYSAFSAGGDYTFSNTGTNKANTFATTGTGSGSRHQFLINGTAKAVVDNNGIRAGDASAPYIRSGAGSPEAAVTGIVGSLYLRNDGGANTTLYVKESGTGNTGWIAK